MRLLNLELNGFKSFSKKTNLEFESPIVSIVGPNGSGKSNVVEAIRFVLGEQSMKSMRGKQGADLIFKGSKTLPKGSHATVAIHFNNKDKVFKLSGDDGENLNLNYDTITISREVFSDGLNKYILNGTEVRLRDINNLLASVNIGSSGHHIISQGEADRILNASSKDRKEMVEDALGLKIYQYKIKESERKLERTEANMKEVSMLRRENAPHLKFLVNQMEKLERTKDMEKELADLYQNYLKKESVYLNTEKAALLEEKAKISGELKAVSAKISDAEEGNAEGDKKIAELKPSEKRLSEIRALRGELERKLGRIEGMLEARENKEKISGKCPLCGSIIGDNADQIAKKHDEEKELAQLRDSKASILRQMDEMTKEEKELLVSVEALKQEINRQMESLRDKEREKFAHKVREQELNSALEIIRVKEANLSRGFEAFENEIKEGTVLVGMAIMDYKDFPDAQTSDVWTPEVRRLHEEQRKKIERIKIKLEDAGMGSGAEITKEFKEVSERDQFLAKEMEDIRASIESLERLIADLKEKIDVEFKNGVKKINVEFQEFFSLMFGGGSASLAIVVENKKKRKKDLEGEEGDMDEDGEELMFEQGIEINVSLPHKKVKELHALSGGERSLTSIALLFAMSQVNPPPFLVLDETDAALDEANSRKYGDMLEKLSKHSQLIVVTHNRETMSRAGMLYGVTMGAAGDSKLLSVRFDEAVVIAK